MARSLSRTGQWFITALLALMLTVSATLSAVAAPVAQEAGEVSIQDIISNPTEYEGQEVILFGEVDTILPESLAFILTTDDPYRLDRIVVLSDPTTTPMLHLGASLEVRGTVRTFAPDLLDELNVEFDDPTLQALAGRPIIVAENVDALPPEMVDQDIVVRVGERTIALEEFDERFMNVVRSFAARQGIPLNQDTIQLFEDLRTQFLEQVATEEALLAEAERRGIEVTDEELQQQIDQLRGRFDTDEAFQQALTDTGFESEERFGAYLRDVETLRRVVLALGEEIEVTDEEIRQFYEENQDLFETATGTVPFGDARDRIRSRLERQRLGERIAELEEEMGIETFPEYLEPFEGFELESGETE